MSTTLPTTLGSLDALESDMNYLTLWEYLLLAALLGVFLAAVAFGVMIVCHLWFRTGKEYAPVADGDLRLATSAHRFHYEFTKQQMLADDQLAQRSHSTPSDSPPPYQPAPHPAADANGSWPVEGNFNGTSTPLDGSTDGAQVIQCAGAVPSTDMEIKNPLFAKQSKRRQTGERRSDSGSPTNNGTTD